MIDYIIKPMETVNEINGKRYVHYKSWQETYTGLVEAGHFNTEIGEYGYKNGLKLFLMCSIYMVLAPCNKGG